MPWRVPPADSKAGVRPDPYRVWLSEVMLQQTTVAAVREYFRVFTESWPDVHALAQADDDAVMAAWAGLGYYARARNLLKCARIVSQDMGGNFPRTERELLKLPGIGPYTAAAIATIAFGERAVVVDGNVERVMARLFAVETPLPDAKPELRALADRLTPTERPGDYAQAVMDLGATVCGRAPKCDICPVSDHCAGQKTGIAASLPRKAAKPQKPVRRGIAYLAVVGDQVVLEKRPAKGLLGGMIGVPTTDWVEGEVTPNPPIRADWQVTDGQVTHTFTHFHLEVEVHVAPLAEKPDTGMLVPITEDLPDRLPTVFRKIFRHGIGALGLL